MKLEIQDLTKAYGDLLALNHLTYTFEKGIYALLGPNGAGKSTLMNILATLLKQSSGEVLWNGSPLLNQKQEYLDILGYMPQKQCLYDDFTFKDFMYYIGHLNGMKKDKMISETLELAKQVKLDDVLNKKISGFSGGMKQRVMLAATLLNNPKIIILDEPTAGLDPLKRVEMQNMIARLSKDKIVIIATHVVSDVEFIANDFIFLKKGEIIKHGNRVDVLYELEGKVKLALIDPSEYDKIKNQYLITSISYQKQQMVARIIDINNAYDAQIVTPTISDIYFYLFRDEEYAVL